VEPLESTLRDCQRLDGHYQDGIGPYSPENVPEPPIDPAAVDSEYRIVVWTASWCGPCKRYKAKEVPALLKAGFKVEVLDYDTDKPPKSVKSVPTIMLYYKGNLLQTKTYWKAKDIREYVDNHLSLKG